MKIVRPITITPTNYFASATGYYNINDHAEWAVATAYVVGDRVIVDALGSTFQCVANNTGTAPTLVMTTPWIRVGASNAWKLFDGVLNNPYVASTVGAPYNRFLWYDWATVYGIQGRFNTVAVLETNATIVIVTVQDQNLGITYVQTINGVDRSPFVDYWEYFFSETFVQRNYVFENIDGWSSTGGAGSKVEIQFATSFTATTLIIPVEVGEIVIGNSIEIGKATSEVKKRLVDYSRKEADAFGNFTLVERPYSYHADFNIKIPRNIKGLTETAIAAVRAVPCVYYPSAEEANLGVIIYGFPSDFEEVYVTPDYITATLSIEGLS